MVTHHQDDNSRATPGWFLTTHWSVLLRARDPDSRLARAALENLCRTYWYPLYAFVRRLGHSAHDSEDLVQTFLSKCIEKHYFDAADQSQGRFRSFLLIALKRFMTNEWHKARARKRGGDTQFVSLDGLDPEQRYALEPSDQLSADKLFERRWALTLLEKVLTRLEHEQKRAGKVALFSCLKPLLSGQSGIRYAEVAEQLGLNEGALKVAVHRLRKRYRELLEEEIAHTVTSYDEVDEERRYLLRVVSAS